MRNTGSQQSSRVGNTDSDDDEGDVEDDEEEEEYDDEASTSRLPHQDSFRNAHAEMDQANKCKLTSGRFVEDVMFVALNNAPSAEFSWLTPDELKEINASMLLMPAPGKMLLNPLNRFSHVTTTKELREVLGMSSDLPEGTLYDYEPHYNLE
ncbi:unnamed protein product [Tuber aestivum]|uniref:Uncharacterized protein n=1 Tax=Tuber aestivum TaxID=59557 RepID=A0A292PUU0_9PEZI|nr:unnamed protein product [Tuber aestivum]